MITHDTVDGAADRSTEAAGDATLLRLSADSRMAALVRAHDWAATPLGAMDEWPAELTSAVFNLLASRFPAALVWGPDLTTIYNDGFRPILGGKPEALGRSFADIWSEAWADIGPIAERAFSGEATFIEDFPLVVNRSGEPEQAYFTFCYSPVRAADGQVLGMIDTVVETTDRVKAEAALRASEERQAFLLNLSDALRPLANADDIQAAAARLLGERLGADRAYYVELDEARELAIVHREYLRGAAPSVIGAHPFAAFGATLEPMRAGHRVTVEDSETDPMIRPEDLSAYRQLALRAFVNTPLKKDGALVGAMCVVSAAPRHWTALEADLIEQTAERTWAAVERARAEAALRELNDTLESRVAERTAELERAHEQLRQSQKLEAMGSLTGGVAHDFNNLLSPIVGALDLLQRKGLGGDRERRMIDGALQSAERARVLVQRLLAFARRQPLQTQAVDVGHLVQGMAELIASTSGPRIRVELDVADALPAAQADANQIEMALLNLSVNARDAMPDGGSLTIGAQPALIRAGERPELEPGRYVRLSVADTGAGMDADTLRRAIEPFFSTKGVGKGTGLGLSMVHGLAAQLGGGLFISSKPALGTCVELWLPASEHATPQAEPTDRADDVSHPAAGVVLLVDDEELVRASTAEMLTDFGYVVIEAGSAEEALEVIGGGSRFDVLVTDHLMPGMSGTELAREALSRRRDVPVLVVSGYADVDGVAPDLPRLVKPFRQADLAAKLLDLRR